jgi:hypothetical protein
LKRGRIQDRRKPDDGHQEDTKRRCNLDMLVKGPEAVVFVKFMAGKAWVSSTVIAGGGSGEVVVIYQKWCLRKLSLKGDYWERNCTGQE